MKRVCAFLVLVTFIAAVLVSCNKTVDNGPPQTSNLSGLSQSTISLDRKQITEFLSTKTKDANFYIIDNSIYRQKMGCSDIELFTNADGNIDSMIIFGNQIYYVVWVDEETYNGARYKIFSIGIDGANKECVLYNQDFAVLENRPLVSWDIYNGKIYIQSNFAFFEFDIKNQQAKQVIDDVSTYHFYGPDIYYIDRSNRTFTLYKMNLNTGDTQIILGDGRYNPSSSDSEQEMCISNFVMTENGRIFYTQRCPYGVYEYGIEGTLIEANENVYEYSLAYLENNLFYVVRTDEGLSLVKYNVESKNRDDFALNDFAKFIKVSHDGYIYETTTGEYKAIK